MSPAPDHVVEGALLCLREMVLRAPEDNQLAAAVSNFLGALVPVGFRQARRPVEARTFAANGDARPATPASSELAAAEEALVLRSPGVRSTVAFLAGVVAGAAPRISLELLAVLAGRFGCEVRAVQLETLTAAARVYLRADKDSEVRAV